MSAVLMLVQPGPIHTAQASSADRPQRAMVYTFSLSAQQAGSYDRPICLDEEVTLVIRGWLSGYDQGQNRTLGRMPVPGVQLTTTASGNLRTVSADKYIEASLEPFMAAEATFKAVKTGAASVTFRGALMRKFAMPAGVPEAARRQGLRAEVTVPLEVIECPLTVQVIQRGEIKAGTYFIDLVGALPAVTLRRTDSGEPAVFYAEGIMPVVMREFAPPATVMISVGTRHVEIRADRSNGKYNFTVTQGEMSMVGTWIGGQAQVSQPIPFPPPPPIRFSMPEEALKHVFQDSTSMAGVSLSGTVLVRKAH